MTTSRRAFLVQSAAIAAVLPLAACGTILYPERKGQKDGRIDPAVVILDGLGLLLFLIPGVIAFAVDFSNGTIYLPGTQTVGAPSDLKQVRYQGPLSEDKLDRIWLTAYGKEKPFRAKDAEPRSVAKPELLPAEMAALEKRRWRPA